MNQSRIRNFSIIAHIDHGKSTLADKLILSTGGLQKREMREQVLDNMDLERERGITIKAQTVCLKYKDENGEIYTFNMIDTPGHVDFTYEVSRSLAACEGVLLIVDATQGIQAQTIANVNLATQNNLAIIPVINKIDLPSADPDSVKEQLEDILQIESDQAVLTSAKEGIGIEDVMKAVVKFIPAPTGNSEKPLQALLFDAWYDSYRGVIVLIRVVEGCLKIGMRIRFMSSGTEFDVEEIGTFTPSQKKSKSLQAGEVGYVIAAIKGMDQTKIGDTITESNRPTEKSLLGYKEAKPMVFSGLYPISGDQYELLRDALTKLKLNDSALHYEPETSQALGFGFRCGFLGMLHMEIIQERLEREYNLELIITSPTVIYEVLTSEKLIINIDNPAKLPPTNKIIEIREPIIIADILVPQNYLGNVITLCIEKRGVQKKMEYLGKQVSLSFEMPMSEVVLDFFDRLKSVSRGFASFDYTFLRYKRADLVKLEILINNEYVDALSFIVHKDFSQSKGRDLTEKIKEFIPRQMYDVAIQAAIGSKILSRQTVKAMRKNVTAKCYGGDITRKRKLLEKQKEGKKRMKQFGTVEIPQAAFMAILHVGKNK